MLKFDVVFMFDYLFCASASSGNNINKLKYLCNAHDFPAAPAFADFYKRKCRECERI